MSGGGRRRDGIGAPESGRLTLPNPYAQPNENAGRCRSSPGTLPARHASLAVAITVVGRLVLLPGVLTCGGVIAEPPLDVLVLERYPGIPPSLGQLSGVGNVPG